MKKSDDSNFGLGVAQIVITAATPMEEIEHPFPGDDEAEKDEEEKKTDNEKKEEEPQVPVVETESEQEVEKEIKPDEPKPPDVEEIEEKVDDLPADSGPFPVSSSSGSDGAESISGPSTAENSQSLPPRAVEPEPQPEPEPEPEPEVEPSESPDIIPNKMLVGGRASIPDELQPDQLEKLQSLKESNA